ncbi:hypothetical protein B0A50_02939 [Salinomyces thailandicus]|uniref:Uncharacterized protein n=1 Tax=Salinomyces thailandicus TaxID=706561 RepID=A0A4U0U2B5_9PEZI|nr:hypothetical protein B0A50_02939 [Salinomyces thailandica]
MPAGSGRRGPTNAAPPLAPNAMTRTAVLPSAPAAMRGHTGRGKESTGSAHGVQERAGGQGLRTTVSPIAPAATKGNAVLDSQVLRTPDGNGGQRRLGGSGASDVGRQHTSSHYYDKPRGPVVFGTGLPGGWLQN